MILGIDVGQKNIGVCVVSGDAAVHRWAVWEAEGSHAKEICECLLANATDEFLEGVTRVVIERQPSKNPTMTRIQHYLEFYFASRNLPVCLQDAKHKLLYAASTPWFPSDATDKSWTYRHRKNLSIRTTAAFLEATNQPLRGVFEASKKKDDLADALWHAMAFAKFSVVTHAPQAKTKKKIVARAPTEKQRRSGKLSESNVKYLLQKASSPADAVREDKALGRAVAKHFGDLETCLQSLAFSRSGTNNRADPGRGDDNPARR